MRRMWMAWCSSPATSSKLQAGDIVPVEIVATQEYDLVGVAAGKPRRGSNVEISSMAGDWRRYNSDRQSRSQRG